MSNKERQDLRDYCKESIMLLDSRQLKDYAVMLEATVRKNNSPQK